jgi:NAD+ synthase
MIDANAHITFLKRTFDKQGVANAVIAVSGGIDSAVSLSLLTQTLSPSHVFPILLPYKNQNMDDAQAICAWNKIPTQWHICNIEKPVQEIAALTAIAEDDLLGNVMARVRMILVYDFAKKHNALVCGTENKSEHYLGYFTRFGDAASDVEPIASFYKTEYVNLQHNSNFQHNFI